MSKTMEDFMSDKQVAQREQSADHPWLRARSLVLKDGQVVVRIEDAIEAAAGPRGDSPLTPWDQGYVQAIRDYGITPEAAAGPRDEGLREVILERHTKDPSGPDVTGFDMCRACDQGWPCDAYRLAKASDHD